MAAPLRNQTAIASAPAGIVTGPQVRTASVAGNVPDAQVERAVGEARVDKTFLNQLAPDTSNVTSALQRASLLEKDRLAEQQQAMALLQEAGRLMNEAKEREQLANAALISSKAELERAEQGLIASANDAIKLKEAQAGKSRALAEISAREAARAKAEESAAIAASKLASAEEAEALAQLKVAEARLEQARLRKARLLETAAESREESAKATHDAAQATAAAEARQREIALAQQHVQTKLGELQQQQQSIAPAHPIGVIAPIPSAHATQAAIPTLHTTGAQPMVGVGECCGTDTAFQQLPVFSWDSPAGKNFKNILHVRFLKFEGLPATIRNVLLRLKIGNIESRSHVVPVTGPLHFEASLPIFDLSDTLRVDLLDAGTSFPSTISKGSWDMVPSLGHVIIRIDKLADGHVSKDNLLRLTPIGAILHSIFHMEPYSTGVPSAHHGAPYNWAQKGGDYWTLDRGIGNQQGLQSGGLQPGMESSGFGTGSSGMGGAIASKTATGGIGGTANPNLSTTGTDQRLTTGLGTGLQR